MSWPRFWVKKQWQTWLLMPLGALVCRIAKHRLNKFKQQKLATSSNTLIIVVGNIVVGGSGKTPFIQWLVQQCQDLQLTVGIVSRGYGGQSKVWPLKVTTDSDPTLVGDEPLLLALTTGCPIAVSPKRPEAIEFLLNEQALDVIISDDGLQHFAMARDLEFVLIDAQRQLGNGLCLPAGPLREPQRRLQAVDFVVYNGASAAENWQMQLKPIGFRQVNNPNHFKSLDEFVHLYSKHTVTAMAGIGNPQRFFETLKKMGLSLLEMPLKDHQAFSKAIFDNLPSSENPIIMTQKDAVKCLEFAPDSAWYLEISPHCSDEFAMRVKETIQSIIARKQRTSKI
ncbi:tetraacyldisaccharide 4'-kinase [Thiosulfativibrio zosterae]|uniref:Tetraacyldisaccharide 4'-kinase n=1 Tax=Thiosulfativibrio zosterae TaxID=2675053 RepID=A0A6F8PNL5_9GAMM|nr:tetraacyldisaccharide 4'-kinase [Thiosulfativibrio zosterae]BBP43634.1 tetraacyldisaccharide 4'-kinase [Thiosulfativibrio zosterae]